MESATSELQDDPVLETEKAWVAREQKQTNFSLPALGYSSEPNSLKCQKPTAQWCISPKRS